MNKFKINANEYLKHNIISYYHIGYTGYKTLGNPDYLNDLKNTLEILQKKNWIMPKSNYIMY